ncbi:MAG: hypothetical protein WCP72_12020 [Desulfomonile sp.]
MTYLDALVNQLFKKSESGETLFYPWGIIGKGYVVLSESEQSRIRSALKVYYLAMFPAMGVCIYLNWLYAAGCAILGLGGYAVWSATVTRRLVASAERLRYSESLTQSLPYYSKWVLVVLSLFSFIFFLTGGFMLYIDPSEWVMGSLCLVFFGVATVYFVFMTRTKLRSKRP